MRNPTPAHAPEHPPRGSRIALPGSAVDTRRIRGRSLRSDRKTWSFQRNQTLLDLGPSPFQEGRQGKTLTQMVEWLIGRHARTIGRDLEQHAAGRPDVDRAEGR